MLYGMEARGWRDWMGRSMVLLFVYATVMNSGRVVVRVYEKGEYSLPQ